MYANSGHFEIGLVRRYVNEFSGFDAVVVPSGSCAGSIRHQHPMIDRECGDEQLASRALELGARAHELSQFLTDVLRTDEVGTYFPHRVTYHPMCHSLRMLGVGDRPLRLLSNVRGIDLAPLSGSEECCGFGGTFAVKNPDLSAAMLADKMQAVIETEAEVLCAGDSSCLMHIGGGLSRIRAGVRTLHLVEILASTDTTQLQAAAPGRETSTAEWRPPGTLPGASEGRADGID